MGPNELKRKLLDGKPVFGPFMMSYDPAVTEIVAGVGFDFCLFDMEHGSMSLESVENCLRACELKGVPGIVRPPDGRASTVSRILDVGAKGLLIPHIKTAEEAAEAVSAMTFGPPGTRGINGVRRASNYGDCDYLKFFKESDEETLMMIQIEDKEGVEALDEIAEVRGLDVIFCGPYDLSRSMGRIGEPDHPDVKWAVEKIVEVAAAKENCAPGLYVGTPEGAKEWIDKGARLFAYGGDTGFLMQGAADAFEAIKHLR